MMGLEKERKKDWLCGLLRDKFGNCKKHKDFKFNEKNVFCVECGVSLCRHCNEEDHSLHQCFQIYRYTYQDVVRSSDIHKFFDCSNIQTYISNSERIVHIKPKTSIKDIKEGKRVNIARPIIHESQAKKIRKISTDSCGVCEECGKNLQDKRNRFCSIACKISIVSEKHVKHYDNQNSETGSSSISLDETYECVEKVNFRKRPRKTTTPLRSPSS